MKPRQWKLLQHEYRCIAIRWLFYSYPTFCSSITLAEPAGEVFSVQCAQFNISDATTIPANDVEWQSIALPHRVPKRTDPELVGYWYKTNFTASNSTQPLWLYLPTLPTGAAMFLNGARISDIQSADRLVQVRWYHSHFIFLPLLSLHTGTNEISPQLAIREPLTSFGELEIGLEQPLRDKYERVLLWEDTTAKVSIG